MASNINDNLTALIEAISALTAAQGKCCARTAPTTEPPAAPGVIPIGEGEQFPDAESYYDARCSAANYIYDGILNTTIWFEANNVDMYSGAMGGMTAGLTLGLLSAGPPGWVGVIAEVVIIGMATLAFQQLMEFADLKNALLDVHDECVLALYNAANPSEARQLFIDALNNSVYPLDATDELFTKIYLSNSTLNVLWEPTEDSMVYTSDDPVACGGAELLEWSWEAGLESWTHRDDSTGNCASESVWDSAGQAIQHDITQSSPYSGTAWSVSVSPALAQAVTPGAAVQVDWGPPSDGKNVSVNATAFYSDATSEFAILAGNTNVGGTAALAITVTKTLSKIEVRFGRTSSGGSWTAFDIDLQEVRVMGAS